MRIRVWPRAFRLPGLRRFDGFAAVGGNILLRRALDETSDDLICHELCHIWQMQHHPLRMPISYLRIPYDRNPFELEARAAVASTPS